MKIKIFTKRSASLSQLVNSELSENVEVMNITRRAAFTWTFLVNTLNTTSLEGSTSYRHVGQSGFETSLDVRADRCEDKSIWHVGFYIVHDTLEPLHVDTRRNVDCYDHDTNQRVE